MNYDHNYHAGNFADVFKHIVLMLVIQKLQQKAAAFSYIDTHAGYPYYDLFAELPQHSQEAQAGIGRLWQAKNISSVISQYLNVIKKFNLSLHANNRYYPGSSKFVHLLKRPADIMTLNELHPTPAVALKKYYAQDKQVACHHQNGYQALKAFLPPKPNRGLVLIDPPFEQKDEFEHIIAHLKIALVRWPNGIYAIWYPIKSSKAVDQFVKQLQQSVEQPVADFRCCPWPDDVAGRLSGSGMVFINPPWQIDQEINAVARELEKIFR